VRLVQIFTASLVCSLLAATPARGAQEFDTLIGEFVTSSLALSPVAATAQGYHRHNGASLDEELDDFSPQAINRALRFYRDWEQRVGRLDVATLDAEQQADLQIVKNAVGLALLDLETIQTYRHNPAFYIELIGNALLAPFKLEYAPKAERFEHIIKRLQKIPRLLDQARTNLSDAAPVSIQVARDESARNFRLIDQILRMQAPATQSAAYAAAAADALDALREFERFTERSLSQHPRSWQLGPQLYREKCAYELALGHSPERLLDSAEADLKATHDQMTQLAAPWSVPEALDRIARRHATPDRYLAQARLALQQATDFVRGNGLVTLPATNLPEVIETPEFMRGIHSVGVFDPAPALEPQLGATYWLTSIPADWPRERIESKLREYNYFGLQLLTIHEAMPGRWLQAEYSNRIQPAQRRTLRAVYANPATENGWAVYAQQMMVDQGYPDNGSDSALRMTLLKQLKRLITNAILDIRLHTMAMTDQQALDLMTREAFQEPQEAPARLVRAKVSSCQPASDYAGLKGWLEIRDSFRQRHSGDYSLSGFNERALSEGAVALPQLARLLQ
jgi:uncharacterized protein (DUF885 family)